MNPFGEAKGLSTQSSFEGEGICFPAHPPQDKSGSHAGPAWVLLNFQVRMPEYMGTCDCYKPAQRLQQACLITQRADSAIS